MGKDAFVKELTKLQKEKKVAETKGRLKDQADYCNAIGVLLSRHGDYEGAMEQHQEELTLCTAQDDSMGQAVAHRKLGEVLCDLDRAREALPHHTRFLEAAQRQQNRLEEQRATATVGRTYLLMAEGESSQGQSKSSLLEKARKWFQKSLQIVPSVQGVDERERAEMTARLHINLGLVADSNECAESARQHYTQATTLSQRFSLLEDGRRAHDLLALNLQSSEDSAGALHHLQQALQKAQTLRDTAALADSLHTRAQVLVQMGDLDGACRSWYKAYKLKAGEPEEREKRARCLRDAVRVVRLEDRLLLLPSTDHQGRCRRHETLGDCYCRLGAHKQALHHYQQQLKCAEQLGWTGSRQAAILASIAATHKDMRQFNEAASWYRRELAARDGDPAEVYGTLMNLADLETSMGSDVDAICRLYSQAADVASAAGLARQRAFALRDMALTYAEFNRTEDEARVQRDLQLALRCDGLGEDWDRQSEPDTQQSPQQSEASDSEQDVNLDQLSGLSSESEGEARGGVRRSTRARRHRQTNTKGETPLHIACIQGKHRQVEKLLDQGHAVNPRDHCGWLPLHEAANFGHVESVRLLVRHGALVSDPGGRHCGGVTPLHDAAGNGHLEVARLLLESGADAAAADHQGATPLDYLRTFARRSEEPLSAEAAAEVQALEDELVQRLRKAGVAVPSSPRLGLLQSPSALDAASQATRPLPESESPVVRPAVVLSEDEDESDAGAAYRRAIRAVGKSAVNATPPTKPRGRPRPSPAPGRSALVGEEEYDWLESDVHEPAVRRRRLSDVFPAETRPVVAAPCRRQSTPTAPQPATSPPQAPLEPASPEPEPVPTEPKPILEPDVEPEPVIELASSCGEQSPAPQRHARRSRKRVRQTRLTPLIMRQPVEGGHGARRSGSPGISPTLPAKIQRTRPSPAEDLPQTDGTAARARREAGMAATLRVFVDVDGDRLMVPVPGGQQPTCTIGWLAEQASERYYRQFLLRPQLQLCTPAGQGRPAVPLDVSDLVRDVVSGPDDLLTCRVTHWDRPPLTRRYTAACDVLRIRGVAVVASRLSVCQTSCQLDLSDLALGLERLRPILRTIQRYSGVSHLLLPGNPLRDDGVQELAAALPHLSGLESLDLSLVKMTAKGLRHLTSAATEHSALQRCSRLSLSYNLLWESCCGRLLVSLLAALPRLEALDLSCCQLTEGHFTAETDLLTTALTESPLSDLRLADNPALGPALPALLSSLPADRLRRLVLSGSEARPAALLTLTRQQRRCALTHLQMAKCGLSDQHLTTLSSVLMDLPELSRLDLSENPDLSAAAGCRLLQTALAAGCPLSQLQLAGCAAGQLQPDDAAAAAQQLRQLQLPVGQLPEVCEQLERLWSERWEQRAKAVTSQDGDLLLSVAHL